MSFKKARIGEHELYYGDCLEVMPTLKDKSIDMIFADLPYGVTARNKWDVIIPFEPLWKQYERIIKDNGAMIFTATEPFSSMLIMSNPKLFRYDLIWEKSHATGFLNARKMPMRKHELILVFYKHLPKYNPKIEDKPKENIRPIPTDGRRTNNYGEFDEGNHRTIPIDKTYPKSIIKIPNESKTATVHPTQKPVTLVEYFIETYTDDGSLVLDNVMGSGTTGVACINTNRRFIGVEKELEYFKIAYQRLKESGAESLYKTE